MSARVSLIDACKHRELLGSSIAWRPQQLELLATLEGDEVTHAWCCSRQSGKTSMSAAAALWGACLRPDLDERVPRGRVRYCLVCSPSEDQWREFVKVAAALVEASPVLRPLATVKADRIDFKLRDGSRSAILAMPARDSSARGKSASMIVFDEAAHLGDTTDGPATAERLYTALTGSTVAFGHEARVLLTSTPAGRSGLFHRIFEGAQSGVLDSARAVHRTIHQMNPEVDPAWLEARRAELGEAMFEQEFLASFVDAGGSFFDLRGIEFDASPAPPEAATSWVAGCDVAFHQDVFGVCLVGQSVAEPGVLLVGAVAGISPGPERKSLAARRREDQTLAAVLEVLEPYAPSRIVADGYLATVARDHFGRAGYPVTIAPSTGPSQTAAFVAVRARLTDGSLRLWNEPKLIEELRRVRARDTTDSIYLPHVGDSHCDRAVALAAAVFHLRHAHGYPEGKVVGGQSLSARIALGRSARANGWGGTGRESIIDIQF